MGEAILVSSPVSQISCAKAREQQPRRTACPDGNSTSAKTRERHLQLAARRHGLKLIRDRYSARTGRKRYFLRPAWDVRQTVRAVPGGGCTLAKLSAGRRIADSPLSLDEIEILLDGWREPMPNAPARLPWQASLRQHRATDRRMPGLTPKAAASPGTRKPGARATLREGAAAPLRPIRILKPQRALEWIMGLVDGRGRRLKTVASS